MHDVTLECAAAVTVHFADAFIRKNVARIYMTLWPCNDVPKLTLTPFCFEKSSVRKYLSDVFSSLYAEIMHVCFIALTFARSLGQCLNTQPNGLVFKQLSQVPANVNA